MYAVPAFFQSRAWWTLALGLRIDVKVDPADLRRELDELYRRMYCGSGTLSNLGHIDIGRHFPGLVFRHRVVDGEHYVYTEDAVSRRLAGYTVFKRIAEAGRKADRVLRSPHSRYAPEYQRRGIATAVYKWWLSQHGNLITGARQSLGAHALWRSLSTEFTHFFVELDDKSLNYLGQEVTTAVFDRLETRMVLLGVGWDFDRFASMTGLSEDLACLC